MNKFFVFQLFVLYLLVSLPLAEAVQISGVTVNSVTASTAEISWNTDVDAQGEILFGTAKGNVAQSVPETSPGTQHTVTLTNLQPQQQHFFKVRADSVIDDNAGLLYSFVTIPQADDVPFIKLELPAAIGVRTLDINGLTNPGNHIKLFVNGILNRAAVSKTGELQFFNVELERNTENELRIEVTTQAQKTTSQTFRVTVDLEAPRFTFTTPPPAVSKTPRVQAKATLTEIAFVNITVNTKPVFNEETQEITLDLVFDEGPNTVVFVARDHAGNIDIKTFDVDVDTKPPQLENVKPFEGDTAFFFEGKAISDISGTTEPGANVVVFVSSTFIQGAQPDIPSFETLLQNAQYSTTAGVDGSFTIEEVDFENPQLKVTRDKDSPDALPQFVGVPEPVQTSPTQVASSSSNDASQQERAFFVVVAVVDEVGLSTVKQFTGTLGNCFSGFFDFDVSAVPDAQFPVLLSPDRIEQGSELITYVLGVNYRGNAKNNKNDPRNREITDDYFLVESVRVESACRRSAFLSENPAFEHGCELLDSAQLSRQVDPLGEQWFIKHNLRSSETFIDADDEFWEQFKDSQIRFPVKVTIQYREKLAGAQQEEIKAQTMCRDLAYAVDIPLDPREVFSQDLLEDGISALNETIIAIDTVLPFLDSLVQYAGIACIGGVGLHFVMSWWREWSETVDLVKCQAANLPGKVATFTSGSGGGSVSSPTGQQNQQACPVKNARDLERCWYISIDEKKPFPEGEIASINNIRGKEICPQGVRDLEKDPQAKPYFESTISAWKNEANLYSVLRYTCDRVWCKAAPAHWTQDQELGTILQSDLEQRSCGATDNAQGRGLIEVDCATLQQKNLLRTDIAGLPNACYQLGNFYYTKKEGTASALTRIDRASGDLIRDQKSAELELQAVYLEKTQRWIAPRDKTCTEVCTELGGFKASCHTPRTGEERPTDAPANAYPGGYTRDCWGDSRQVSPQTEGEAGFNAGKAAAEAIKKDAETRNVVPVKEPSGSPGANPNFLKGYEAGYRSVFGDAATLGSLGLSTKVTAVAPGAAALSGFPLEDRLCFCVPSDETAQEAETERAKRGTVTAKPEPQGWPWNYREAQLEREKKGGVYYPPERYYEDRDFPAAFGQDHLFDTIKSGVQSIGTPQRIQDITGTSGTARIPQMDPGEMVGSVQTACLSVIRARLVLLKGVLQQFQACLEQVKTTGQVDAGVCREILTQFVCNMASSVWSWIQTGCFPIYGRVYDPLNPTLSIGGSAEPGVTQSAAAGFSAIGSALENTQSVVAADYGNARVEGFFEGGTSSVAKKMCLAAFGVDTGFDLNTFFDSVYATPFTTSVVVTSSNFNMGGRRQFLTFDPATGEAVYEYRAAWMIMPGCDFDSYRVELAAVTEKEQARFPNIECDLVDDDLNPEGCDNIRGANELITPFASGGRIKQGQVVNENAVKVSPERRLAQESPQRKRYDHIKISLRPSKEFDIAKCVGNDKFIGNGELVFYFPITDSTDRDIIGCEFNALRGEVGCSLFGGPELGNAWIENVECFDPVSGSPKSCKDVFYTPARPATGSTPATVGDIIRTRVNVFTTGGEDILCLKAKLVSPEGKEVPEQDLFHIVPPTQGAGVIPIEVRLPAVQFSEFSGAQAGLVSGTGCSFVSTAAENAVQLREGSNENIMFSKSGELFTVDILSSNIQLVPMVLTADGRVIKAPGQLTDIPLEIVDKKLVAGTTGTFTTAQLREVIYLINGFGVRNLFPSRFASGQNFVTCIFRTELGKIGTGTKQFTLKASLLFPVDGQCTAQSQEVPVAQGIAQLPRIEQPLQITEVPPKTEDDVTVDICKRQFRGATTIDGFREAARTCTSALAVGDPAVALQAAYFGVSAHIKQGELEGDQKKYAPQIFGILKTLIERKKGKQREFDALTGKHVYLENMVLFYLHEFSKGLVLQNQDQTLTQRDPLWFVKMYESPFERDLTKISISDVGPIGGTLPDCSECQELDDAWKLTRDFVSLKDKFYAPEIVSSDKDIRLSTKDYRTRLLEGVTQFFAGTDETIPGTCREAFGVCVASVSGSCPQFARKSGGFFQTPFHVTPLSEFSQSCGAGRICCRLELTSNFESHTTNWDETIPLTVLNDIENINIGKNCNGGIINTFSSDSAILGSNSRSCNFFGLIENELGPKSTNGFFVGGSELLGIDSSNSEYYSVSSDKIGSGNNNFYFVDGSVDVLGVVPLNGVLFGLESTSYVINGNVFEFYADSLDFENSGLSFNNYKSYIFGECKLPSRMDTFSNSLIYCGGGCTDGDEGIVQGTNSVICGGIDSSETLPDHVIFLPSVKTDPFLGSNLKVQDDGWILYINGNLESTISIPRTAGTIIVKGNVLKQTDKINNARVGPKTDYVIEGNVGAGVENLGSGLDGGTIAVKGNIVANNIGDGMRSGRIIVLGQCTGTAGKASGGTIWCNSASNEFIRTARQNMPDTVKVLVGGERVLK